MLSAYCWRDGVEGLVERTEQRQSEDSGQVTDVLYIANIALKVVSLFLSADWRWVFGAWMWVA